MNFHVLTLFPEMILQGLHTSITGRAIEKGLLKIDAVNIRDYTMDKHGKVDDYPYGGGAGMLMQAQPVFDAWKAVTGGKRLRTIYVTPQGTTFTQNMAKELAREEELVFLCGHYEGIDERALKETVTDYVSIGDYVLTGGELPVMVMIDAISRLVPGVLNNGDSAETESFHNDLLEYPQYSRPEVWHDKQVPAVLLSGDHKNIMKWRLEESKKRTKERRPDLYEKYRKKEQLVRTLERQKRNHIFMIEPLKRGKVEVIYEKDGNVLLYNLQAQSGMMLITDLKHEKEMLTLLPKETQKLCTIQEFSEDAIKEKSHLLGSFSQALYTRKEALRVIHKEIRKLEKEDACACLSICNTVEEKKILEGIENGRVYGAFLNGDMVGFVGEQRDESTGLLFVKEEVRGRGIGKSLLSYCVNRQLERGDTPYLYFPEENTKVRGVLESLGFYFADKKLTWWQVGE